jgi:hypothetical protein
MSVILATFEAEIREDCVSRLAQAKNFMRPHFNRKKLGVVTHVCQPSYSRKLKIGGLRSPQAWAKSRTLSQK